MTQPLPQNLIYGFSGFLTGLRPDTTRVTFHVLISVTVVLQEHLISCTNN